MFCHKCGSKSLEGADFCQKCGAKLIRSEAMEQSPAESTLNTVPQAVEHTSEMPATPVPTAIPESNETTAVMAEVGKDRNKVIIHGYSKIGNFDRKIKVFRNGELVGKVGQGETIVVPNNTDGTFLFKCSPMKAQYTVKAGNGELQLEWDLSRLKVFDLSSGKPLEKLEQIKKNNKKWVMAGSILMGICAIVMLIAWFMSDGGTNHVELVRYANPFEDADITATYEMVIDKYFTSPKWKERKGSDSIWYVDVNGKIAIDGEAIKNVTLTFKVTPEGNKYLAHTFMIDPYGIDIDGQPGNAEQASSFITALFDAYSQNYESMESYTTPAANSSGESGTENSSEGSQSMQWKVAYTNKVQELAAQNDELQFALIDLTESDIPALVADYSGYYVSVFIWADETLVTVMEDWAYGAMGNHGYEYLPGGNVIRNQNSDQAGAIVYESYMTMNDAHEVVALYDETLSFWFFKDSNGNGTIDENEPFSEEPYYYYGNTEISKEEYDTYRISGEYEWITGDKSTEEILSQLNGESGTETSYPSISYKGIPISNLLGSTDDVIALLGDSPLNDEFKLRYDDMEFYHENGNITSLVSFDPSLFEADGIPLNQNRDGLIKIFGQNREEGGEDGVYYIKYNLPECSLFFELGEHDSEAWRIWISPGATMDSALGEISYKGIPIIPLLETSMDDIMTLLGKPTDEGQYLQGYFYDYNNEILFILDADKRNIIWIEISPEVLTTGDLSLDKDRAFLIKTFGGPTEEYIDEMTHEYTISYNMKKYALAFLLPDSNSKVSKVRVYFSGL